MSDFAYSGQSVVGLTEIQLYKIQARYDSNWALRPVDSEWGNFISANARQKSDGRLKWRPLYSMSIAQRHAFKGTIRLDQGNHILGPEVGLKMAQYGRVVNMNEAAMFDPDGWVNAPALIDRKIALEPSEVFAAHLNWGHKITDWTGSFFFKNSSGNKKYSNPTKKSLPKWHNMLENRSATPLADRIDEQLQLLAEVRDIEGNYMGLAQTTKRYCLLPTAKYRAAAKALNVLTLVPATDGVTGGGGNTSKIFGDAIPIEVPWLRSDALITCVAADDEDLKPFIQLRGSRGGDGPAQVNYDIENVGAGQAEFETIIYDTNDNLYKTERKLGFARLHWRGYGLGSPHTMNISYDTLSTTTADGIVYSGSLPELFV